MVYVPLNPLLRRRCLLVALSLPNSEQLDPELLELSVLEANRSCCCWSSRSRRRLLACWRAACSLAAVFAPTGGNITTRAGAAGCSASAKCDLCSWT